MLAKTTVEAEFPSFETISNFSAMDLPKDRPPVNIWSPAIENKVTRLSQIFNKPRLPAQFRKLYHRAWLVFRNSNFQTNKWDAWREAAEQVGFHDCDELIYVNKRGRNFAPVTSAIEQSFSFIAEKLGDKRLNASPDIEDRNIHLFLMKHTEASLDKLLDEAIQIWKEVFPRHSRTSKATRSDKDC